jgi:3-oxoacyl-[acyl-carrier-protein] synthase-1
MIFSDERCETDRHKTVETDRHKTIRHKTDLFLVSGAIRNDATHISAPSRTGEGCYRALQNILQNESNSLMSNSLVSNSLVSKISFINAHGTATPYNDAMEANALMRAGLENIPVNGLKSYFGHTLGAAGVVESIISMQALSEGIILKTLGFEEGESITIDDKQYELNICKENCKTNKKYFVKIMSGFGGVNAALLFATNYTDYHE